MGTKKVTNKKRLFFTLLVYSLCMMIQILCIKYFFEYELSLFFKVN